jgi:hypothetical protein
MHMYLVMKVCPFVDDISNYKDKHNYHPKYDSSTIQWMKKGVSELKVDAQSNYFHEIDEKASGYQLQNFANLVRIKLEQDDL